MFRKTGTGTDEECRITGRTPETRNYVSGEEKSDAEDAIAIVPSALAKSDVEYAITIVPDYRHPPAYIGRSRRGKTKKPGLPGGCF